MTMITKMLPPKVDAKLEFIEFLRECFSNNRNILVPLKGEVIKQVNNIVNNSEKNNNDTRSHETQIVHAMCCTLEHAIVQCVPDSWLNPAEFDHTKPSTFAWDVAVRYKDKVYYIDATAEDKRGFLSANILPKEIVNSEKIYHWGKFNGKYKYKDSIDFIVGGKADYVKGLPNVTCNLNTIVPIDDMFDYNNWSRTDSYSARDRYKMYLNESVTYDVK